MADKVSILDKDGVVTYYSTYGAARAAIISLSIEHPLIQIWATLTNEQIVLLNGVDIWIAPGVTIDYLPPSLTTAAPTITDNGVECHCQIYGTGVIKNTFVGTTGNVYECIKITNVDTELEINCDYIEGVGKVSDGFAGVSIRIENGEKFHLTCNKVYNQNNVAMYIGSSNIINDINFRIEKVETGIPYTTTTGTTAIITRGNGFIDINEILCRNLGHCLSHRAGSMTAMIRKMTTIMNFANAIAAVHVDQGSGTQKLILYFDEILSLAGAYEASLCIEHHQGTGIFIGRRVISDSINFPNFVAAIQISSSTHTPSLLPKGYLKIDEIVSKGGVAMYLNDFTELFSIDSSYIECNGAAVISSNNTAVNYLIKNAKLKNLDSSSDSKGIALDGTSPILTFKNVKIVSGGKLVNLVNGTVNIKNYGLFGNKDIDNDHVTLLIGNLGNYQFIPSTELT